MIRVTVFSSEARKKLQLLQRAMTPPATDMVIKRTALTTERRLIERTPKKTGQTRRYWITRKSGNGYMVTNTSKVMVYLEKGTRAHGPVTAKALYIPLKLNAMVWHRGLKFGRDYVLAKRVRGIRARNIVSTETPRAEQRLRDDLRNYVRSVILAT